MVGNFFIPAITEMGINFGAFKDLAWDDERNSFNMTLLALRHSCFSNGVSRLHGKVARDMFRKYYGGIHPEEIPVTSITNGVHTESWLAWELRELFARYLGKGWPDQLVSGETWEKVDNIPDEELWRAHYFLKDKMISYVRSCLKKQYLRNREPVSRIHELDEYLDPDILTIGFARRFATYKRANLLLCDPGRLDRLVNNRERPVRIIFAGKAHPADLAGQELITQIHELSNRQEFRGKILLLENYDIHMARHLVQGVDVWLNTPRRPMEASGTSGQKAALNGVINVSTLDGWWPEAYNGKNGFAVGTEISYQEDELQDRDDCYSLYSVLEEKLVPMYYRKEDALPREWLSLMKESIKTIAPVYNTSRMVAEYTDRFYVPAIKRGIKLTGDNNRIAHRASVFKKFVLELWDQVAFHSVESNGKPKMRVGEKLELNATVRLGPIYPKSVAVEVVYGEAGENGLKNIAVAPMTLAEEVASGVYRYHGSLVLPQGALGYTVRVRPDSGDFHYTELPLVTWAPDL
jgi:starch phosphorylase